MKPSIRFRISTLPADERDRLHFEIARELYIHGDANAAGAISAAREFLLEWDAAEGKASRQWPAPQKAVRP